MVRRNQRGQLARLGETVFGPLLRYYPLLYMERELLPSYFTKFRLRDTELKVGPNLN